MGRVNPAATPGCHDAGMAYTTDDLPGHLRALDMRASMALHLPDVPEPRRLLLKGIQAWVTAHQKNPVSTSRGMTPEIAGIEREVHALHDFIESDRRQPPTVGTHRQSTTACGAGPEPGPDWPHF